MRETFGGRVLLESILSSGFQERLFLLLEKQIKNYFTLFCNASPNKHLPAQSR